MRNTALRDEALCAAVRTRVCDLASSIWPSSMVRWRRSALTTKTPKRSQILKAVDETTADLRRLGFIDKRKQQGIKVLLLQPVPQYNGRQIRALREREQVSQTVLASLLNTSASTVRKWEIGDKSPSGPSCKLLNLLDRKGLQAVL